MKKDFFHLEERGTTVRREVLAGITTFMTMAYVLAVQPSAICGFGPDAAITDINGVVISKSALLVMCALVSGIITLNYEDASGTPQTISKDFSVSAEEMNTDDFNNDPSMDDAQPEQTGIPVWAWVLIGVCGAVVVIVVIVVVVRKRKKAKALAALEAEDSDEDL